MALDQFPAFAAAVHDRFNFLTKSPTTQVFVTSLSKDDLWAAYLASFPEGTNPVFRERTEHDCACCRNFVKNLGRIVVLHSDGSYQTVWDVQAEGAYGIVAAKLAEMIRQHPIETVYRTKESAYGAKVTYEALETGQTLTWNHFHGQVPAHLKAASPGEAIGEAAATYQVLQRGLEELSLGACETVADLITANALYRGEEHLQAVKDFTELKRLYDILPREQRAVFAWGHIAKRGARFRNTVIGTLVQELSEGMDLAAAVARFESKVAPQNYRRTTALITPKMIESALETLRELGLEAAVRRRLANVRDLSANDVLFVDRSVRPHMKDNLADLLMESVRPRTARQGTNAEQDISGEDFINNVLPGATSVELALSPEHLGNFVSLTAPEEDDGSRLFSWNNGFAWAYDGDVADSIKQRVKAAGGNIDALLRVSLSWSNYDDLDVHCESPFGHVYFANKANILDVDMNAGGPRSRTPVENLAFTSLRDGTYRVFVNQYARREADNIGFEVEYEHNGEVRRFSHDRPLASGQNVDVLAFTVTKGVVVGPVPSKQVQMGLGSSAEKWGLTTGQTVPVDMVLLSPNHWGDVAQRRGNKHYIFSLRGCKNPDRARGFFGEFLRPELNAHRKVFEVLGAKTMCPPSDDQLSGVGFSSTRHDRATFVVRKDDTLRTYNVQF